MTISTKNVFAKFEPDIYPFRFHGRLKVERLMGGTPSDKNIAAGWLKAKLGVTKEEELAQAVAEIMATRPGTSEEQAIAELNARKHLNGFRVDVEDGNKLFVEGRHLKAAIKEAASVARAAGNLASRFGETSKGTLSFVAEHIVVVEERLYLGQIVGDKIVDVTEPTGVIQSFPKNPITRQTGIQYTEHVDDAIIDFTVITDWEFSEEEWAAIWITGGNQGLGASRSQGYGRYQIIQWEQVGKGEGLASRLRAAKAKKTKATADA